MSVSEHDPPKLSPEQIQAQSMLNAPVPRLYANGFAIAQTNSDVSVVLLLNGAPSAVLSMSFISAKTLIEEMGKAMQFLEDSIEQKIPTMNEVAAKLLAQQSKIK
jgi:hypothetical protein